MSNSSIDRLIINSPYTEPTKHWNYDHTTREHKLTDGRRPAGFVIASKDSQAFDDPGKFQSIPLVDRIRKRVRNWREEGWPGVSGITRRLLEYWTDPEEFESRRFFFCQIEAVETLIWLTEGPESDTQRRDIPNDGGSIRRLCSKMATGAGKTVVMAMVGAWQILNKVTYPRDRRFSKNILVVAPGLTVKNRLAVLDPKSEEENYYESFRIVPSPMLDKLRQGTVVIRNWHALNWESEEKIAQKRGVDKRGALSDEAYVRDVLGDLARAENLLVINDEAHHAWRVPTTTKLRGVAKAEREEATKWIGGLDRINRARGISVCYDFTATPFIPSGKQSSEEALFGWIVSDFGLNDAIESGLVKTPRVVVRDDAIPDFKTYKSRLYHIYNDDEVKDDLNQKADPQVRLPDLVNNAYHLLGADWQDTKERWEAQWAEFGEITEEMSPPVMITVANRTETAARIKFAFDHQQILVDELCDPSTTLHIDSKVLEAAESAEKPIADVESDHVARGNREATRHRKMTRKQQSEWLRQQVDTVGQSGKPGHKIQNVISVGMLSEGWDAKNVTHIMGLRAFTSQLLCEQVIGRGLRRTSYEVDPNTGLFEPEYVNVFGVPFTFLPHEGGETVPKPPQQKIPIEPIPEKREYEISWPNVIRIEYGYQPRLTLNLDQLEPIELDAVQIPSLAELAPIVDGNPDIRQKDEINLEDLARKFRLQRIVFTVARDVYNEMQPKWQGGEYELLSQLVSLMEQFMQIDRLIQIKPALFAHDNLKRRLVLALSMSKLYHHIWDAIHFENVNWRKPVYDRDIPILSTADMRTWFTGKPTGDATHSHINRCVYDSTWEEAEANTLDRTSAVVAWVKNDHLGFEVRYLYRGAVKKYRPDFLIRLASGDMLVLETKGLVREQDKIKRRYLEDWVGAVNSDGGFGRWHCDVSTNPADVLDILAKYANLSDEAMAG